MERAVGDGGMRYGDEYGVDKATKRNVYELSLPVVPIIGDEDGMACSFDNNNNEQAQARLRLRLHIHHRTLYRPAYVLPSSSSSSMGHRTISATTMPFVVPSTGPWRVRRTMPVSVYSSPPRVEE